MLLASSTHQTSANHPLLQTYIQQMRQGGGARISQTRTNLQSKHQFKRSSKNFNLRWKQRNTGKKDHSYLALQQLIRFLRKVLF